MSRVPQFKIKKVVKRNKPYWRLFVPSHLNADKKERYMLFAIKADAERKRGELIAAYRGQEREAVVSSTFEKDAMQAMKILADAGVSCSLTEAVQLALPMLKASGANITVAALLDKFASLKQADWRPTTARNFKYGASKLTEKHGNLSLIELTTFVLQEWLNSFTPAQACHMARTMSPAFSYAVRQGMLPSSPFEKVELPKKQKKEAIDVFTPAEARKLLATAPDDCKAAFAMLLFAGIRPNELTLLKWENVRDGFIHITPGVAKTVQVRNVEIEPNLAAWLGKYRLADTENICPLNWRRKSMATRAEAGLSSRPDAARHSYATYHLQKYKNKPALEENMGHMAGSDVLMRHYRAASTPAVAAEYWSIYPSE